MSKRILIITADDFGYNIERNRGIVECFDSGFLTRTSLLVNGLACKHACQLALEHNIPVGLHLNLTEGHPISSCGDVSSLLFDKNVFLDKIRLREGLESGKIDLHEVRTEITSQIEYFKYNMNGQLPKYVDGHQHVHVYPGVRTVFAEVMASFGIFDTRLPNEVDPSHCHWLSESYMQFIQWVVKQSKDANVCFTKHNLKFAESFYGLSTMGRNMSLDRLQTGIASYLKLDLTCETPNLTSVTHVTCELMCHPGYRCQDIAAGGCGNGADEFSQSEDREHEMRILCSEEMQEFYKKYQITL